MVGRDRERPQAKIRIEGTIERVYFGSMGDWPVFGIRALDGSESEWTREGDARRYVEGLGVRLSYVEHPWKRPAVEKGLGETTGIVLTIEVEDTPLRSAGVAPGPYGLGYELSRRDGEVRHYLRFPTANAARAAEHELPEVRMSRVYDDRFAGSWLVQVLHDDPLSARRLRDKLGELARRNGGSYDGGEIVAGEVWGAEAS